MVHTQSTHTHTHTHTIHTYSTNLQSIQSSVDISDVVVGGSCGHSLGAGLGAGSRGQLDLELEGSKGVGLFLRTVHLLCQDGPLGLLVQLDDPLLIELQGRRRKRKFVYS